MYLRVFLDFKARGRRIKEASTAALCANQRHDHRTATPQEELVSHNWSCSKLVSPNGCLVKLLFANALRFATGDSSCLSSKSGTAVQCSSLITTEGLVDDRDLPHEWPAPPRMHHVNETAMALWELQLQ